MTTDPDHETGDAVEDVARVPLPARLTAVVAVVGLVIALAGLWIATRPVSTPTQDCGVAAAFILDGRVDVLVGPAHPPAGVSAAQARSNNDRTCQQRAASKAGRGALLVVVGTATGLVAAVTETTMRSYWRHRRRSLTTPFDGLSEPHGESTDGRTNEDEDRAT